MKKTPKHLAIIAVFGIVAVLLMVAVVVYANARKEFHRAQADTPIGDKAEERSKQLLKDAKLDRIVNARHVDPSEAIGDTFADLRDGTIVSVDGTKYRISIVADITAFGEPTPKAMPMMMMAPMEVPSGPPIKIEDGDARVSSAPTG